MTDERTGLSRAEPPPIPNDSPAIADLVIADMQDRKAAGIAKYGVPLQANNGRDPLIDAYQEALDLAVYLRQAIAEQWVRREDHDLVCAELRQVKSEYITLAKARIRDETEWRKKAVADGWVVKSQYEHIRDQLTQARAACDDVTAGPWIWTDTADDDLPSMADGAVISITAGHLRALLERWRTMALQYQARHATLRGLQLAVQDAVHKLEERNDPSLDTVVDPLVAALGKPANSVGPEDVERLAESAWIIVSKRVGISNSWPPPNESWAVGMREAVEALAIEMLGRSPVERPWVNATDPIVETWIGRDIEVFDHEEPWPGRLRRVEADVLRVDYNDHGDLRCLAVAREHRQVRLVEVTS